MALTRGSIYDRELHKFIESPSRPGEPAVEVVTATSFGIPSGATCYTLTLATDAGYYTEVYRFYSGGTPVAPTGLLKTVTLYYTDSARTVEYGGVIS
jgi:hypothetical protein